MGLELVIDLIQNKCQNTLTKVNYTVTTACTESAYFKQIFALSPITHYVVWKKLCSLNSSNWHSE